MDYIVTISNIKATSAVELKQVLTNEYGLVDGRDFTWAWHPAVVDQFDIFANTPPAHVEFKFAEQSNATFFQLKYSR